MKNSDQIERAAKQLAANIRSLPDKDIADLLAELAALVNDINHRVAKLEGKPIPPGFGPG
jgi:ABC-type transporter Mla subunit MlaD